MASRAMRLFRLPDAREATPKVFLLRHGFQVAWPNAASDTAQVVQLQPVRYGPNQQFVGKAMRVGHGLLTCDASQTVLPVAVWLD